MAEELQQIYNNACGRVLEVLDIFNEFFGEDRVDLQGLPTLEQIPTRYRTAQLINSYLAHVENIFILVHFPSVRVTNEHDRFTTVNHLYAKVSLNCRGQMLGRFGLNRAEYTVQHFTNGYMHSHVSEIPLYDFTQFQTPCTGSGPINNTICSLVHDFDADLWRLFCLELDKYVQVESVAGVPYHKLENLTDRRANLSKLNTDLFYKDRLDPSDVGGYRNPLLTLPQIAEFTKYVIDSDILKFSFGGTRYQLAISPTEYAYLISNLFIKWYNEKYAKGEVIHTKNDLTNGNVLYECKIVNGEPWAVSRYGPSYLDYQRYIGSVICSFKGQPVTLSISDVPVQNAESDNTTLVLNGGIRSYVTTKILNVINFRYGNNAENPNQKGIYFL